MAMAAALQSNAILQTSKLAARLESTEAAVPMVGALKSNATMQSFELVTMMVGYDDHRCYVRMMVTKIFYC